jgi:hypothetical protein
LKWKKAEPRKRRTREHVIADLSVNHVERFVLRCGWTVQRTTHDYGVDLLMETFDENGCPQNGRLLIQIKATDHITMRDDGNRVAVRLDERDVNAWRGDLMPVILILYDAVADKAYWLHVQDYFSRRRSVRTSGATTTVYLPISQIVDEAAIRQFGIFRDAVVAHIRGVIADEE